MEQTTKKKRIVFLLLLFMSIGFIFGVAESVISDLWSNTTSYVYVNTSYPQVVNVSGLIYENNSRICSVSNGLCAGTTYNITNNIIYNITNNITNNITTPLDDNVTINDTLTISHIKFPSFTMHNETMQIYADSDINTGIHFLAPDVIALHSGGGASLLLASTGYIGINTYSPKTTLDVNGTILATSFNGSWNGSSLYYLLSNPLGFYNSSTLPSSSDNLTYISNNIGNFSANNNSLVKIGDANKTLVYCGNITGAISNLCTITSGVGSSNNWVNYTTINISTNGTTLKNITELSFLALANNNYTMRCDIYYASQNITNGISLAIMNYSSSVNRIAYEVDIFGVSATTTNSGNAIVMGTKITSTAVTTINVINTAHLNARILNGASNTLIMPQYSGEVAIPLATNNTIITSDSFCNVVNG